MLKQGELLSVPSHKEFRISLQDVRITTVVVVDDGVGAMESTFVIEVEVVVEVYNVVVPIRQI